MSTLLALSFDAPASPSLTLRALTAGSRHVGWGVAWYPPDDHSAVILKDPTTLHDNAMTQLLRDWARFRSTVFISHLRGAAQRISQEDTHPFGRAFARRDWVLTHNGYLERGFAESLPIEGPEEPIGHTDTEHVLCWLIGRLRRGGWRRLADVGWERVHAWFSAINSHGTGNFLFTDGECLIAYQDIHGVNPLHWQRRTPPHGEFVLRNEEVDLDLGAPLDVNRTVTLVATQPLSPTGWHRMSPGGLLVLRRGAVIHERGARLPMLSQPPVPATPKGAAPAVAPPILSRSLHEGLGEGTGRFYVVEHRTTYTYRAPVELSHHTLRLRPAHDAIQRLLAHEVLIGPEGTREGFEDVFGNLVLYAELEQPYERLQIVARSAVQIMPEVAGPIQSRSRRSVIPVDWMPWQRQMMMPYLLPPELPESHLRELFVWAMGFVSRQDYDLVETCLDLNQTIFRDYTYVAGSTTLQTTPFQVYASRRGVCQDFANLLICVARLLGVPARYRVGYLHTGADYANTQQAEASHAWVELYLPWAGWRGFDPTNGCRAGLDHIRVACGRSYLDATPTAGTIYRGGGGEVLDVTVQVRPAASSEEALALFHGAWRPG